MKRMIESIKNNLLKWISSKAGTAAIILTLLMLTAWLIGWIIGQSMGGVIQIFEQSAFGLHDAGTLAATIGGVAITGNVDAKPLTTDIASQISPTLLRNEIDDRIVKIRPMSTPLDQISRYGGSRLCGSMKVEYYSVDTKPTSAKVTTDFNGSSQPLENDAVETITTDNDVIFQTSTTIIVPGVKASSGGSLVLYVVDNQPSTNGISVMAVNNIANGHHAVPKIPKGATLIRMGRAATELDVMTPQFEMLPTKANNYCQIFKAQVEQTTFMKIANKEVGWTFSDQEEAAIIDMRMGMERTFLFGQKAKMFNPFKNENVTFTGGVWHQTDNEYSYDAAQTLNEEWLVKMCRQAFSHNAGSSRKVLLAGSELIEKLHLTSTTKVMLNDSVTTKWGLDFTEIHSKFGTLYVMLAEVFDQCGMSGAGMVIDPEYITKYCHVPFRTEKLDLRQSGVRNVDAIVITEASCLVLRYPQSHMRIVCKEQV